MSTQTDSILKPQFQTQALIPKKCPSDFIFLKIVGEGSFSTVYKARDVTSKRVYAIKVMDKRHILKFRKQTNVRREKECLQLLNKHPSPFFVKLYATFQDTERLYIVTTYALRGEILAYLNIRDIFIPKDLPQNENDTSLSSTSYDSLLVCRFYAQQLILAIEHLYRIGIIHRDIKPENILLDDHFNIRLIDFGSAALVDKKSSAPLNLETLSEKSCVSNSYHTSPVIITNSNNNSAHVLSNSVGGPTGIKISKSANELETISNGDDIPVDNSNIGLTAKQPQITLKDEITNETPNNALDEELSHETQLLNLSSSLHISTTTTTSKPDTLKSDDSGYKSSETKTVLSSQNSSHLFEKPCHIDGNLDSSENTNTSNNRNDNNNENIHYQENKKNVRRGSFVGTAQYVSPEVLTGKNVDYMVDIWAFGCVFYQFVTGYFPFHASNEYHIFQKIMKLQYDIPESLDERARDLIEQILKIQPEDRLGSPQRGGFNTLKEHAFFRKPLVNPTIGGHEGEQTLKNQPSNLYYYDWDLLATGTHYISPLAISCAGTPKTDDNTGPYVTEEESVITDVGLTDRSLGRLHGLFNNAFVTSSFTSNISNHNENKINTIHQTRNFADTNPKSAKDLQKEESVVTRENKNVTITKSNTLLTQKKNDGAFSHVNVLSPTQKKKLSLALVNKYILRTPKKKLSAILSLNPYKNSPSSPDSKKVSKEKLNSTKSSPSLKALHVLKRRHSHHKVETPENSTCSMNEQTTNSSNILTPPNDNFEPINENGHLNVYDLKNPKIHNNNINNNINQNQRCSSITLGTLLPYSPSSDSKAENLENASQNDETNRTNKNGEIISDSEKSTYFADDNISPDAMLQTFLKNIPRETWTEIFGESLPDHENFTINLSHNFLDDSGQSTFDVNGNCLIVRNDGTNIYCCCNLKPIEKMVKKPVKLSQNYCGDNAINVDAQANNLDIELIKIGILYKRVGLFAKRRIFLLCRKGISAKSLQEKNCDSNIINNDDRILVLYYVEPQTLIVKGHIDLNKDVFAEAKSFKLFEIHTPNRTYYLEDVNGYALKWCKTLNEQISQHINNSKNYKNTL